MNFLTKIVIWISVAMITGFFSCGLAFAENEDRNKSQTDKSSSSEVVVVKSDVVINGASLTPEPFTKDQSE